ncbi:SUF system Fe-S cluster assembly protein [Thiohalophilus thiocyanatoxydans]|uniref:FeS assembly SUF system protein n=1 Tax=Thiohalophilus thiocyanatoxydans TaxID=381308 RepID=A0A4V3H4A7_9GAMM|nr:SUF system Fe-S cluster assembly protein [Thiohalophilus thiocyanatoxydans]TDY02505.1 FeS assembly SUF system protein [Thiohalophilus thiocyanatoxydans]
MSARRVLFQPQIETGSGGGASVADSDAPLEERIVEALKTIYDPEIPVNIYELGLIYEVNIDQDNKVFVTMTLTTPGCPVAGSMPGQVEQTIKNVEGVNDAEVELVWDPPWTIDRMTEEARLTLGLL